MKFESSPEKNELEVIVTIGLDWGGMKAVSFQLKPRNRKEAVRHLELALDDLGVKD